MGFLDFGGKADNRKKDATTNRRRRRHSSGDRETWNRKIEYFFASLGYAVGLANILRFPYLCYRNGGGAFLIPYLLSLAAAGIPMLFLEMGFGQFASLGPITIWRVSPLFKGIGYAMVIIFIMVNTYYNVLVSYSLFYLFASITAELPWSSCKNKWNTKFCVKDEHDHSAENVIANVSKTMISGVTGATYTITNASSGAVSNITTVAPIIRKLLKTPTEEFFERHLLKMSGGIHELGPVQWPLIVCLAVSWLVCFLCLFKGIKSMGKAVYFTTIFSYVILTVLLIRGATLPGSLDGVIYYLKPDFKRLASLSVWGEASAQAFASLALGGGGWITLSSYNKFNNKCNRDAVLIGIGNTLSSLYAGFVIFCVLGFMAHVKRVDMQDVTAVGPGLAFVAYPEGLALIPGAPFWAICFFFMMFTVGLDSLFGQVETVAAGIIDEWPDYLRPHRKLFTLFMCLLMFFLGIPLVSEGGIYIVTLLDWYSMLFSLTILSLFEIIALMYVYGYRRFAEDIQMMTGTPPNLYYKVTWLVITPLVLLCAIAFLAVRYKPVYYGNYTFPPWAESIGWAIGLVPVALVPITMIVQFFLSMGSFSNFRKFFTDKEVRQEVTERLVAPTLDWGPALPEIRRKFSYSARLSVGGLEPDDDVFEPTEGAELMAVKHKDPEKGNGPKKEVSHDPSPPQVREIPSDQDEHKA